jgi:hypothetical protein
MATRTYSSQRLGDNIEAILIVWQGLLNGDDGAPYQLLGRGDRSVQFIGTFGAGGSIQLEGSNDGTNYAVLSDPSSTTIVKTATAIEQVLELTRYVRPRVTVGDGTTALECWMLFTR